MKSKFPLWWLVLASLVCYLGLAFWFPLGARFNHAPVADIRSFAPSLAAGLGYAAVLCLLYGLYLLAWRGVTAGRARLGLWPILGVAAVLGLPLLFTFPVNANDIYRYWIRGRITVVQGQSPYALAPADFPDDPYLPLAGEWKGETSPYGPIWEGVAAGVTALLPDNLWLALLSFKGLGLLVHLAVGGVIWLNLAGMGMAERAGRTLLWAWNPALLLTFVMDGHNDGLMILWLLLGYWLMWERNRPVLGLMVMALAPLTKPIGLLPLPFFAIAVWQALPDWRRQVRFVLLGANACLGLALLAFLPFGSALELGGRLWREAAEGASFSIGALLILLVRQFGWNLELAPVANLATGLFILVAVGLMWLTWRGRLAVRGAADIFFAYVWQALNFRIWYATWPFAWLLFEKDKGTPTRPGRQGDKGTNTVYLSPRLAAGLWFLLTSQLSVIVYGQVRVYWLGGNQLLAHALGVPFTFLLPVLLALAFRSKPFPGAGDDNQR